MAKVEGAKDFEGVIDGSGSKESFQTVKSMYHLVPPQVKAWDALVYTVGAAKYAPNNWMRGIVFSQIMRALETHFILWAAGETYDPETKLHHLAQVRWNAGTLLYYDTVPGYKEFDDRVFLHGLPQMEGIK